MSEKTVQGQGRASGNIKPIKNERALGRHPQMSPRHLLLRIPPPPQHVLVKVVPATPATSAGAATDGRAAAS